MLIDYHWHTARCGHASGTMQEYIDAARKIGLTEVGFADHIPLYWLPKEERDPEYAMADADLPRYIKEVQDLQQQNLDISIKLGLEVDFIPGHENKAKEIIKDLPLDYVLGSIHYLDGWSFDNPDYIDQYQKWDIVELYQRYFEQVCTAASSGLFDIIAHTDLIKKFGYRPPGELTSIYQRTAQIFAQSGVCVELNTAGLRVPAKEIYPAVGLLKLLYQYQVPVTIGSDAHNPAQVGQGLNEAKQLLKAVGYDRITIFKQRTREYIKL